MSRVVNVSSPWRELHSQLCCILSYKRIVGQGAFLKLPWGYLSLQAAVSSFLVCHWRLLHSRCCPLKTQGNYVLARKGLRRAPPPAYTTRPLNLFSFPWSPRFALYDIRITHKEENPPLFLFTSLLLNICSLLRPTARLSRRLGLCDMPCMNHRLLFESLCS